MLGVSLLFPSIAEAVTRPLVSAGSKLQGGPSAESGIGKSFVLGISTGLLWAPCAGPILGLILTGAAIQGPGARSSFLLLSFALGAATSLGIALFAGNKVFSALKRSLSFEVWIRRGLGVAVILGVVAIALGWDTNLLTKFSFVNTAKAEEHLIDRLRSEKPASVLAVNSAGTQPKLDDEGPLPDLSGAVAWLNSPPLSSKALKGKVVLIDFWTSRRGGCRRWEIVRISETAWSIRERLSSRFRVTPGLSLDSSAEIAATFMRQKAKGSVLSGKMRGSPHCGVGFWGVLTQGTKTRNSGMSGRSSMNVPFFFPFEEKRCTRCFFRSAT